MNGNKFKSFGIMMIKPDGLENKCDEMLEEFFYDFDISVIDLTERKLTKNEIKYCFYYQFDEFIEYMTSSNVRAYFVGSKQANIAEELFKIKKKIRISYGVESTDLKNVIHSAQSGLEFYLQRKLFFDKYISYQFTYGKDMHVKINNIKVLQKLSEIYNIKQKSKLESFVISISLGQLQGVIEHLNLNETNMKYSVYSNKIIDNSNTEIIYFLNKKCINEVKKVRNVMTTPQLENILVNMCEYIGLGRIVFNNKLTFKYNFLTKVEFINNCEEYYFEAIEPIIKEFRINSILMDSPVFNLQETEARGEIAIRNNLNVFGGSSDVGIFGLFGAYHTDYKELDFNII